MTAYACDIGRDRCCVYSWCGRQVLRGIGWLRGLYVGLGILCGGVQASGDCAALQRVRSDFLIRSRVR